MQMRINMVKAREKAGLTQSALGEQVGAAQSSIARIESGENIPRADLGLKIAEALGITLRDLLVIEPQEPESAPAAEVQQ